MSKFTLPLLIALILSLILFAGCGGKQDEPGLPGKPTSGSQDLGKPSDEDCFVWRGDVIVDLTDKGQKQTDMLVPARAVSFDGSIFADNANLRRIGFQNPDTELSSGLFMGCSALETVLLPENLGKIPDLCFVDCSALKSIHIPTPVTRIGNSAFRDALSLAEVTGAQDLEVIDISAFSGCNNLESFPMGSKVTQIRNSAFASCEKLQNLKWPSSLREIGDGSFKSCLALTEIELPDGLETIETNAFAYCNKLVLVKLPSSVSHIGRNAFVNEIPTTFKVKEGSYADEVFILYSADKDIKEYYN